MTAQPGTKATIAAVGAVAAATAGAAGGASSSSTTSSNVSLSIFQGRFILKKLLGKGGFGEVYSAIQTATNEPVAVKMERRSEENSFLFHEARVMQDIQRESTSDGQPGIATLKYFGQEGDFRMLIMTLQGPSLEDIHEERQRFGLKTTVMLADQMISRLEYVHSAGFVHRDLKPDNFLIGRLNNRRIYMIDFGLSCRYRLQDGRLREMQSGKSFIGTSRYASLRTHQGFSQSRRDDLEQLVYVMIYMHRGHLPWSGLNIKNRDEKEKRIGEIKASLDPAEICANCPRQFADLLYYARNMLYNETPQYHMCRALLKSVLDEMSPPEKMDYMFEWLVTPTRNGNGDAAVQAGSPATPLTQQQQQHLQKLQQSPKQMLGSSPLPQAPAAAAAAVQPQAIMQQQQQHGMPQQPQPPQHSPNVPPPQMQTERNLLATRSFNSPPVSPKGPDATNNVLSNAKAQGIFSGFGSGALSQEIVSMSEKN